VFEDQLLCADLVILNKADLMTGSERRDVTPRSAGRCRAS
jgi:G3E family GTPase